MARLDPEDIGLHSIRPKPGSRHPRKRLGRGKGSGQGKTAGRGHKGAGARSGAKERARIRGRPEPDPHADAQAPRTEQEDFDAVRAVPDPLAAGQRLRPRRALRRRRRGDPGDAEGRRPCHPPRPGQGARARRDLDQADRPRPRLQRQREGEDRSCGRHGGGNRARRCFRRSSTPSPSRRFGGRSGSRWRCSRSTGSGPTSRRPASTSTRSKSIEDNFTGNNVLGFLNLFSGGSLQRLSLFALGIMPYITASIILQLLTVVVPALERLQKEGEVGQQKITQYTRYLTVGLAFGQSLGYVFLFQSFQNAAGESVVGDADVLEGLHHRDLADGRLHAADVARRADHPARRRQRHLADDLRLDRFGIGPGISTNGGRTPTRSSS